MQWINSKSGYGWLSIALHWLAAAAVIVMLITGFQAGWAGDAGDRAARSALMGLHISFGASVALVLLARVFASYAQPRPTPPEQAPALKFLSSATHQILLLAILVQIISGPLAVWSGGRAINIFDVVSLSSPFAERNQGIHEIAELLHAIGRWALIGAISLHVLGALKHAVIDRDGVLNVDRAYVHRIEDFEWIAGAQEAIKLCNDRGYFTFVVTNQSGVARGYYDVDAVHRLHDWMNGELAEVGAHIDEFQYCPYHEDGVVEQWRRASDRRKPAPGMILDCFARWPIRKEASFLIGDRADDLRAAAAAGIAGHLFEGGDLAAFIRPLLR